MASQVSLVRPSGLALINWLSVLCAEELTVVLVLLCIALFSRDLSLHVLSVLSIYSAQLDYC